LEIFREEVLVVVALVRVMIVGELATALVSLGESLGRADLRGVKNARVQARMAMSRAALTYEYDESCVCGRSCVDGSFSDIDT
jgi:hypothetical protein